MRFSKALSTKRKFHLAEKKAFSSEKLQEFASSANATIVCKLCKCRESLQTLQMPREFTNSANATIACKICECREILQALRTRSNFLIDAKFLSVWIFLTMC